MFHILIAEDDPSTARLLGAIVKRAGYEPLIAADGVQALEMLDHNHIDLLLCDVMMPRMDGFASGSKTGPWQCTCRSSAPTNWF